MYMGACLQGKRKLSMMGTLNYSQHPKSVCGEKFFVNATLRDIYSVAQQEGEGGIHPMAARLGL